MVQKLDQELPEEEELEERERNKGTHLEINRDELESFVKKGIEGHQWVQQGPFLVCKSCPIKHAVWIGMNKKLVGIDEEGKPIFQKIGKRD